MLAVFVRNIMRERGSARASACSRGTARSCGLFQCFCFKQSFLSYDCERF